MSGVSSMMGAGEIWDWEYLGPLLCWERAVEMGILDAQVCSTLVDIDG